MKEPMDGDVQKLIKLLKKILKSHPNGADISKIMGEQAINLNLCFFAFVPMDIEDVDDFEAMCDEYVSRMEEAVYGPKEKLEFKLSQEDVTFLKQNGIKF